VGNSILLIAVAVFFSWYAWMAYATDSALAVRGVHTTATIVSYASGDATLQFKDREGRLIEAVTDRVMATPRPAPGDIIQVVYDPQDPAGRVRDARLGDIVGVTVLLVVSAVIALVTGILVAAGVLDLSRLTRWWRFGSVRTRGDADDED
jgi:hypothetical protein